MPKRILAVDDDADILEVLMAVLNMYGFDVDAHLSADNIFEDIAAYSPDLILLDIMLSGKDGREVCKMIKDNGSTSHIPVIMVSATPESLHSIVKSCGANDFVAKPFDISNLHQRIERLTH